jgi:hypothetical protein
MIVKRRSRGIGPANGKTALVGLLIALTIGLTIPSAGGLSDDLRVAYEYTSADVIAATEKDLMLTLAPYEKAGRLNRNTPDLVA